ncbi:MAG: HAMP domain-containing histidine kinase [Prevotella sp.]|jgi:K+-sensing histidine kinase KdpD|nr:HAMP domain-containing histidine kinase [Prevotella sp.]
MVVVLVILIIVCLALVLWGRAQQVKLAEMQKSRSVRTAFLKGLIREVRTHLHSVGGLSEIISKDDLYLSKSEKRHITTQIKYNTSLISTLLDELSILSDVHGGHQLKDERFSPNILCERCIDANLPSVHEGVRLTLTRELTDSYSVEADYHIIELIINKLVACSCQFTMKGDITLGCHLGESPNLLVFYVQDTGGTTIPEDRKASIFDWFDNPDENCEPTEFDLSVAQRLAEKVGGYLRYDELWTQGTRMEFTLPVR